MAQKLSFDSDVATILLGAGASLKIISCERIEKPISTRLDLQYSVLLEIPEGSSSAQDPNLFIHSKARCYVLLRCEMKLELS